MSTHNICIYGESSETFSQIFWNPFLNQAALLKGENFVLLSKLFCLRVTLLGELSQNHQILLLHNSSGTSSQIRLLFYKGENLILEEQIILFESNPALRREADTLRLEQSPLKVYSIILNSFKLFI